MGIIVASSDQEQMEIAKYLFIVWSKSFLAETRDVLSIPKDCPAYMFPKAHSWWWILSQLALFKSQYAPGTENMPCLGGTERALQLHGGIKPLTTAPWDGEGFYDDPLETDIIQGRYKTPQRQSHPGFLSST